MGVPGRRRRAQVPGDGRPVADLRRPDGTGRLGQPWQFVAEFVDDPGVRDTGAEPDDAVLAHPLGEFGDARQVEQHLRRRRPEVQSDHQVGTARDRYRRRVLGLGAQRVGPGGWREKVHGVCSRPAGGARATWLAPTNLAVPCSLPFGGSSKGGLRRVRLSALVETSDSALLPIGELVRDPDVRDVVTTDLLDPRRYLSGGELVLTGLAWWRPQRPRRTREFVDALGEAGVAALAAGEAQLGAVPDDLILACGEAGLP